MLSATNRRRRHITQTIRKCTFIDLSIVPCTVSSVTYLLDKADYFRILTQLTQYHIHLDVQKASVQCQYIVPSAGYIADTKCHLSLIITIPKCKRPIIRSMRPCTQIQIDVSTMLMCISKCIETPRLTHGAKNRRWNKEKGTYIMYC